jgi:hypothetical protein
MLALLAEIESDAGGVHCIGDQIYFGICLGIQSDLLTCKLMVEFPELKFNCGETSAALNNTVNCHAMHMCRFQVNRSDCTCVHDRHPDSSENLCQTCIQRSEGC